MAMYSEARHITKAPHRTAIPLRSIAPASFIARTTLKSTPSPKKTITERIKDSAIELLQRHPDGLRHSKLVKLISENDETPGRNTINGSIWNLDTIFPDKVCTSSRGLFRLVELKAPKKTSRNKSRKKKQKRSRIFMNLSQNGLKIT